MAHNTGDRLSVSHFEEAMHEANSTWYRIAIALATVISNMADIPDSTFMADTATFARCDRI